MLRKSAQLYNISHREGNLTLVGESHETYSKDI